MVSKIYALIFKKPTQNVYYTEILRDNVNGSFAQIKLVDNKLIMNNTDLRKYLSEIDYSILKLLFIHFENPVTRDQIAEVIWGTDFFDSYSDYAIDKHISDIRKILRKQHTSHKIKTIRGSGYILL